MVRMEAGQEGTKQEWRPWGQELVHIIHLQPWRRWGCGTWHSGAPVYRGMAQTCTGVGITSEADHWSLAHAYTTAAAIAMDTALRTSLWAAGLRGW